MLHKVNISIILNYFLALKVNKICKLLFKKQKFAHSCN